MADASVRPARAADVPEIARIQLDTWRTAYSRLLPEDVLSSVTAEQAGAQWAAAVGAPPTPDHHVLVAQEGDRVVGFAALGPADPADAEGAFDDTPDAEAGTGTVGAILVLLVEPRWGRRGHGSRLLAAAVDHLRAGGMDRAVTWVLDRDTAAVGLYESAGWARDGYARMLEAAGGQVREIRLRALLDAGEQPAPGG